MVKKIDKAISAITHAAGYISCLTVVVIMLLITVDVVLRKTLRMGINGSYEIVECLLMILVFASFAFAQTLKGHIHVTVFIAKFPRALQSVIFGILGLLSTGAAAFCAYSLLAQAEYSQKMVTATSVLYIPLFPFFYVSAVCVFLFAVALLWDAVKCFIAIKSDEALADMKTGWD